MQILESSPLGLRSARLVFSSKSGKSVTLFPMVHIGTAEFYRQVHEDALTHDAVLIEGVRSPITKRITRSYRWIVGAKRLGLIVQPKLPETQSGPTRVIHADLSHDEFVREWRRIPLHLRVGVNLAAPIYGAYRRWFSTLEGLARGHSMDDLTSRNEALGWTASYGAFHRSVVAARDVRLIQRLSELLEAPIDQVRKVAIVYGGEHMRAVIAELTRRREFIAGETRWMNVF
jgi:hypothetical protein